MPLNIYPDAQRELQDYVVNQPAAGPGPAAPDIGTAFTAALNANNGSLSTLRALRNQENVVSDWLDAFEAKAGYRPDAFGGQLPGQFNYDALNKAYQTEKTSKPDFDLTPPPTVAQAWQSALDIEKGYAADEARATGGQQTFLSQAATAAGNIGGFAADPVTILSSGFGVPEAEGALAIAAREAAVFGAQSAAVTAAGAPVAKGLNPNFGLGDILSAGGTGALTGAALGAVGKLAIPALLQLKQLLLSTGAPRDALNAADVVTRQAINGSGDLNAGRGAGTPGTVSFQQNAAKAEQAVAAGQPVTVPESDLFASGGYRPAQVFTPDGGSVGVQYGIAEGRDLITSNAADGTVNPNYPAELQPRDRTRATSADQINSIATNLEPERLGPSPDAGTGAPIIGPDNVVESGNARTLAILQAYDQGGPQAQAYRDFLSSQGLDVSGMDQPVLVGRRTTPLNPDDRAAFTASANQSVTMRLSQPEQALADARLLDQPTLEKLDDSKGIGAAANVPFVRAFIAQLPKEERGGLVSRAGSLSQEGERRVQAALLARAYGDPRVLARLLEAPEAGMRGIGGALTDASPAWTAMREAVSRGTVPAQMDLTPDLLSAFHLVETARSKGETLADLLGQVDMFAQPVTPATKALLGLMFRDDDLTKAASRKSIAAGLRSYAEEAAKNTSDARLFGEPLGAGDVLGTALQKAGREDLAAAAEEAMTPEAVAKSLTDPKVDDATIHAAEHLIEERAVESPPSALSPDEVHSKIEGEEARYQGEGGDLTGRPGPRDTYRNAIEQVPAEQRDGWLAHGISSTRGGTRTDALLGMIRDKSTDYHSGLLLGDEGASMGGGSTRTNAPYILVQRDGDPRGSWRYVVVNSPNSSVVDAVRELLPKDGPEVIGPRDFADVLMGRAPARNEMMVPDPEGTLNPDGTQVMRPLQELFDEADAEIAAAKAIEGCATGALGMGAAA